MSKVKNRTVFMIGGYEPKSASAFFKRTKREYARFGETWKLKTHADRLEIHEDGHIATVNLETTATDWQVKTTFNFLVWNELVLGDFSKPLPVRLWRYFVTFLDYVLTGTMFSFFRTNWRFAIYFFYPAFMFCLFGLVSIFAALKVSSLGFPGGFPIILTFAVIIFTFLLMWLGKRWHILHLMDLWSFSRRYLHNKRVDAEAKITLYAQAVIDSTNDRCIDEIVLVGHSTGGALILDVAATALAMDPDLANKKCRISLLTVGSTALKIGLHPAARQFRDKIQTLVDNPGIEWAEYQSRTVHINFYKTDPVKEMNLEITRKGEFPVLRRVRIRDMLEPDVYARVKRNFFRVHYQFIMANSKPYYYDFFMFCCGPLFLKNRAMDRIAGVQTHNSGERD